MFYPPNGTTIPYYIGPYHFTYGPSGNPALRFNIVFLVSAKRSRNHAKITLLCFLDCCKHTASAYRIDGKRFFLKNMFPRVYGGLYLHRPEIRGRGK